MSKIAFLKARIFRIWHSSGSSASLFRNTIVLSSGTIVARILGILSMPIITRIYVPEHMGILAVFTSFVMVLLPFGTLMYSRALPLPRSDAFGINLAALCAFILVINAVFITFFWAWYAPRIMSMFSIEVFLPYWWLLPLAVIGVGLYELLSNWATREKAFAPLARTRVWQAAVGAVAKIGLGLAGLKPMGLLIGQIINQAGGAILLSRSFLEKIKSAWNYVSLRRMLFLCRFYSNFPKYRLPSQFLLVFSGKAPLLFFAWQFGAAVTGQFGLAIMAISLPVSLFGQAAGRAYYAEIAKIGRRRPESIYRLTKTLTTKLFLISIPLFLILFFFGPNLFEFIFGVAWRQAGGFASLLSIYLVTQFVSSPLMNVWNVFGKQQAFLFMNALRTAGIFLVFAVAYMFDFLPERTVILYSIVMSFYYFFAALAIFRKIRRQRVGAF